MTRNAAATASKEYIRPMPATWWLRRKTYFLFMVRELTCVFVGGYAVFLLVLVARAEDQKTLSALVDGLSSTWSIVLHLVGLAMAVYHSVTWFNLTPKVMVVWRGEERVSPTLIAGSNYVAWLVVSSLVAWIALRAG